MYIYTNAVLSSPNSDRVDGRQRANMCTALCNVMSANALLGRKGTFVYCKRLSKVVY